MALTFNYSLRIANKNIKDSSFVQEFDKTCTVSLSCNAAYILHETFDFGPTTAPKEIQRRLEVATGKLRQKLLVNADAQLGKFLNACNAELMGG